MSAPEINYCITTPEIVSEAYGWNTIQELQADALANVLPEERTLDQIDAMVGANDFDRYVTTHMDPNTMVGNELRGDQKFYEPRVVIADVEGEVVGYLYSALNVSGGGVARAIKYVGVPQRVYHWQREVAVSPEVQQNGVGRAMLALSLRQRDSRHPVTTYVWKDETPFLYDELTTKYRMRDTGAQDSHPYGEDDMLVQLHRLEGYSREIMLAARGRGGRSNPETLRALTTASFDL